MTQDPWDGLLDGDETILWQGRPSGAWRFEGNMLFHIPFALFFTGFSIFWMIMASQAGGGFWMFGLIFFFVGLGQLFSAAFLPTYKRRHTWYTLTNKRAFIATNMLFKGKTLKSYDLTPDMAVELEQGPPDTVYFSSERRRTNKGSHTVKIGFEHIDDGRAVLRLMRDHKPGASAP